MSSFQKSVMTENGLTLLTKAFSGEITLEFVKMVYGSGIYTTAEKAPEQLKKNIALKEQKQERFFSSKEFVDADTVSLKTLLSNEDVSEGYYINEIGIYAKAQGTANDTAVLYSIAVAEIADYLPAFNGNNPAQIIQEYYVSVNDTSHITITMEPGVVALAEDLEKHIEDTQVLIGHLASFFDETNIENAFYQNFTLVKEETEPTDVTAMTSSDIEDALNTTWNGESSEDITAMSAEDVSVSLNTTWNGESSEDETAMSAEEIDSVIGG